eukprot:UN29817
MDTENKRLRDNIMKSNINDQQKFSAVMNKTRSLQNKLVGIIESEKLVVNDDESSEMSESIGQLREQEKQEARLGALQEEMEIMKQKHRVELEHQKNANKCFNEMHDDYKKEMQSALKKMEAVKKNKNMNTTN